VAENHNPKIIVHWRPTGAEPSSAWRRLWTKLLASRKDKRVGTAEATTDGEDKNGEKWDLCD